MMACPTNDKTFDPVAAYGSEHWIAARFGRSHDWLKRERKRLESEGFPPRDPLTGFTLKADVDAWLAKRRRVADPVQVRAHEKPDDKGQRINLRAF
ncbi:hypothetical protein SAMN05421772_11954 [Paracoccus saliphilus]|uniref:Uncharacterized protein n=2 Tax=Paracoccus saliphilus TaxID=405559 RepID=A0AA45W7P9_9RHOB|nr:hypothetical protein SAMN05421772_11954 [Paracoccus saliphilus]